MSSHTLEEVGDAGSCHTGEVPWVSPRARLCPSSSIRLSSAGITSLHLSFKSFLCSRMACLSYCISSRRPKSIFCRYIFRPLHLSCLNLFACLSLSVLPTFVALHHYISLSSFYASSSCIVCVTSVVFRFFFLHVLNYLKFSTFLSSYFLFFTSSVPLSFFYICFLFLYPSFLLFQSFHPSLSPFLRPYL